MPSIDSNFQQALASFSKRLTKQEVDDFKFSSISDVLEAVEEIQVRLVVPSLLEQCRSVDFQRQG
jgi:isopentenyldiphosphate isomerase